jgi:hypothetical protein
MMPYRFINDHQPPRRSNLQELTMSASGLVKKLLIKPGYGALILNAPDGYLARLEPLPAGVTLTHEPAADLDWVQLFVQDSAALIQWSPVALASVKHDGLLWICYPKGGAKAHTDLNRDILWKLMEPTGLRPVALVAIDDRWSAMRFRPTALVASA